MNKVILIGRLISDPEVRYSGEIAIAHYTLAVDRKGKKDETDFINCVAFGKSAEFAEKYFSKGIKIAVSGRIQTGSYTNKDGVKVYTTDVIVEESDFCEKKVNGTTNNNPPADSDGFMNVPDDGELPFAQPNR